ncbi:MAG TPA: DMT family transporter [Pseudonocardiaceae bacterium]|nr:DMT family transporter [Pseudonocardiaceae bacterium]
MVSVWTAVAAALGASTCGATASTLQHRTAVAVAGRAHSTVVTSVVATITHRPWLLAVVLQGVGFGLHALALRFGQLSVVQPLLVCAVLFALPLNRVLRRERITARELTWAGLLVVGLAGFLLAGTPSHPVSQPVDVGPAILSGATGLAVVVTCAVVAWQAGGRASATILGVASGILFTGEAALLKATVELLGRGPLVVLTSWQPYALTAVGLSGIVFSQLAFRFGPLSASLPVVATVNPVLGVLVGAFVYDENVRDTGLALGIESASLILLTVATLFLATQQANGGSR